MVGSCVVHCWFMVGSLWFAADSLLVHGWFTVGSLLVHLWFMAGSLVVHSWFTGGSRLVRCWFAVSLLYFQLTNINVAAVLRLFCCLFFL